MERPDEGAHHDDNARIIKFLGMIVAVFHDHFRELCCRSTVWHASCMNRLFQDVQIQSIEINDTRDEA